MYKAGNRLICKKNYDIDDIGFFASIRHLYRANIGDEFIYVNKFNHGDVDRYTLKCIKTNILLFIKEKNPYEYSSNLTEYFESIIDKRKRIIEEICE